MTQSSRTSGRRSRNTTEASLAASTQRLRSLGSVNASVNSEAFPIIAEPELERAIRSVPDPDEHTSRWCPTTGHSILVGPDRECPACGSWAPST